MRKQLQSDPPPAVRHSKLVWLIVGLCVFSLWHLATDAADAYTLSHGRQVILNRGLQIQALAFGSNARYALDNGISDIPLWSSANFTTINFWNDTATQLLTQLPAGTPWGRVGGPNQWFLASFEQPYAGNLVSIQYLDEVEQTQEIQDMEKALYAAWNASNTLAYTNFAASGDGTMGPTTLTGLKQFMQYTKPDMLSFDYYPFTWGSFSTTSRNKWYSTMQMYRTAGLAGYDDAGTSPIPYAQFLDLWRTSYSGATPSESYVRLQQNASWAFGYSMATAFVYNEPQQDSGVYPVMFNQPAVAQPLDSNPNTTVFNYVAETNRQSRNLGPALIRLVSSGIFMKPGSGKSVSGTGLTTWSARAGATTGYADYITGVTPYTNSTENGGTIDSSYSDILVGYFKPLLDDNRGATFVDGLHFMIVNGSAFGTADASAQWYHLTFDFTGSDYDSLVRLSRDTGQVEAVSLMHLSGSQYYLDLKLPGGTGDLFAFWDSSNPLPTIPEPGPLVMLLSGLSCLLAHTWRKRKGKAW